MDLRVEIDPLKLEDEITEHSVQFHRWAERQAEAQAAYDEAKSDVELAKAKADYEIRGNPETFGLTKATEASLASAVLIQPEVRSATHKLHQTRKELEYVKAAVSALEHRKRMLTMLVELWVRNYYAEPIDKEYVRSRGRQPRHVGNNDDNDFA